MDTLEKRIISAQPHRRAALLQLAKLENPANEVWDNLLQYGKWIFFVLAPAGLILFGRIWPSSSYLTGFWFCLFMAGLVLVLLPAFIRHILGLQSVWHRFGRETLTLENDYLEFSMSRTSLGSRSDEAYLWRMRYSEIKRIEYDRKSKTLKLIGRFDEQESRKAEDKGLPRGMRPVKNPESQPEGAIYLEFYLIFPDPVELLEELEERCGVYMHPAKRADDMADLRDLQGIKHEKSIIKPMTAGLLFFTAAFIIMLGWQGKWLSDNPYEPYPPTGDDMLGVFFEPGQSAVLNGCKVTLEHLTKDEKAPDIIHISIELENICDMPILFHNASDPQSNIRITALYGASAKECTAFGAEDLRVLIEPGGVYQAGFSLEFDEEQFPDAIIISVDSDRWPPEKPFWREEYVGETVEAGGRKVKSNEVAFFVEKELIK